MSISEILSEVVSEIEEPSPPPRFVEKHCTVAVTVKEFSDVCIHRPGEISFDYLDTSYDSDYFRSHYTTVIYANGHDDSSEGFVSVVFLQGFKIVKRSKRVELSCTVAIIDHEGCRRFPRSTVICHDISKHKFKNPHFVFDCYVSRQVLMKQSAELIPDDTLTLKVEVVLRESLLFGGEEVSDLDLVKFAILGFDFDVESSRMIMSLDSSYAKRLREVSSYFERMSMTSMKEGISKRSRIPHKEFLWFLEMAKVLLGSPVAMYALEEIFSMYAMADKYGIEVVVDACRSWLKLMCRSREDASKILEFADLYDDKCLKESIEVTEDDFQVTGSDSGNWTLEFCKGYFELPYFLFKHRTSDGGEEASCKQKEEPEEEDVSFDFYS